MNRRPPGDAAQLFALAVNHHRAGQLSDAESLYRQVIALDNNHAQGLHYLGIVALQSGRPEAAIEPIARSVALNAQSPEPHYNLAFAYQSVGRLAEAVTHYERATSLKPDYVEAQMNLGNVYKAVGRLADATARYERVLALNPNVAQVHFNIGNVLVQQGRAADAIVRLRRALELDPKLVEAHNGLGIALTAAGEFDAAKTSLDRALELNPNFAEAYMNLGNLARRQDNPGDAARCYARALAIRPDFSEVHNNIGTMREAEGKIDEALASYRRAVELNPDFAQAHNNLGVVLTGQGDLGGAVHHLERAVALRPDYIEGHNNLARAMLARGDAGPALGVLARALAIRETAATKALFVGCIVTIRDFPKSDDLQALVLRALTENWGRANDLAPVAAVMVMQYPPAADWIARAGLADAATLTAQDLIGPRGLAAANDDALLGAILRAATIRDIAIEKFLTVVRRMVLDAATSPDAAAAEDGAVRFAALLAEQCYINEFIFAHGDEELARAHRLRDDIVTTIDAGRPVAPFALAALACYVPLHALPVAAKLLDMPWPQGLANLLTIQVRAPREERELRGTFPLLNEIGPVSAMVREQYEQHPYPRWVSTAPPSAPVGVNEHLRAILPLAPARPTPISGVAEILVAGCGTGQQAIETAQRYANAKVLAVDLSLSSLSYAKRKARSLGLTNLEFAQADILKLDTIGRTFDVVASSGVVHHLSDPFGGWRTLVSLMRPDGLMTIGVYSEVARTDIAAARAFIAERGFRGVEDDDIRRCRQELIALDGGRRFENVWRSPDFFSMSACRDLLFHVNERNMTMGDIARFVGENDLQFLGFEIYPFVLQNYRARFPEDRTMTDLASWEIYERENPSTFSGMYQFWLQRKA